MHCHCSTHPCPCNASPFPATAQLIFAAAKLLRSMPQHHTSFPLQCFAPPSLNSTFLLLCEPMLCRSFSPLIFSRRCPGTAKQSVAAAYLRSSSVRFSNANHSHAYAIQSNLFGSEPLPNQAKTSQCTSYLRSSLTLPGFSDALHFNAFPPHSISSLFHCSTALSGANLSSLFHCDSYLCHFSSTHFPSLAGSRHGAQPCHCTTAPHLAIPRPLSALHFHSISWLCHSPAYHCYAITKRVNALPRLAAAKHPLRFGSWPLGCISIHFRYAISSQVKRPLPLLRHWPMPLNRP